MSIPRTLALIALSVCFLVPVGSAADGSADVTVSKVRIDFERKTGHDAVYLRMEFDPDLLHPGIAPDEGAVAVKIGPVTVISLPPEGSRGKWKANRKGVFRYRVKRAPGHPDSLELKINTVRGVMKLTADRQGMSELRGRGPEDVEFSFTVSGATFTKTLTMGQKDNRWRYRYSGKGHVSPKGQPGGGGGGGGGSGTPDDGLVSIRTLNQGSFPGLTTYKTTVVRTEQAYTSEWLKRYPPPPPGLGVPVASPPPVDFTKEIVVIIDLGTRPSAGHSVSLLKATATGDNLRIDWVEKKPGANCVVATVVTYPFVIAAVGRRDGSVTFSGSVVSVSCP